MTVRTGLEEKLFASFSPESLEVIDDSALHAGHAGARQGGESHFTVKIVSAAFAGRSRLERHRLVNQVLAEELAGPVHALVIEAKTPEEAGR